MNNTNYGLFSSLKRHFTKVAGGLLLWAAAAGCGVTEQQLDLAQQTFTYDLNFNLTLPNNVIPTVPCPLLDCASLLKAAGVIDNRIAPLCDSSVGSCAADVNLTILYILNIAEDPAFKLGIAQRNADSMRDVKMYYGMTNSSNLDIDKIDVHLAPKGVYSRDAVGVAQIGSLGPIAKTSELPDKANFLLITDGSPAHTQIVANVKTPEVPINVLMFVKTRMKAGAPVPAGKIEVRLFPQVTLLDR